MTSPHLKKEDVGSSSYTAGEQSKVGASGTGEGEPQAPSPAPGRPPRPRPLTFLVRKSNLAPHCMHLGH